MSGSRASSAPLTGWRFGTSSIVEIALDSGYEGPEAFSRAFKQRIGQTPSGFRKQPQWIPWHAAFRPISETRIAHMKKTMRGEQVRIVEVKDTRVAVLEHRGDPALIGDSDAKVHRLAQGNGTASQNQRDVQHLL